MYSISPLDVSAQKHQPATNNNPHFGYFQSQKKYLGEKTA